MAAQGLFGRALVSIDTHVITSFWQNGPGHRGRVPLAGSIRLILLIRAMERDVPADRIGSSGTSQNGDPNRSNMADALATY